MLVQGRARDRGSGKAVPGPHVAVLFDDEFSLSLQGPLAVISSKHVPGIAILIF